MADHIQSIPGLDQRRRTASLVYVAVFLTVTTACFMGLFPLLDVRLVHANKFSLLRRLDEYSPFIESLFCALQLFLAILFVRMVGSLSPQTSDNLPRRRVLANVSLGLMTGLASLLVTSPVFLRYSPSALASFFVGHLNSILDVAFIVMLLFVLPILSEMVFRGIFLARLLDITTLAPSLILSTFLFAWTWQVFNPLVGIVFGMASGFLFYRIRSLLACIVANAFLTLGGTSLLVWRALNRS